MQEAHRSEGWHEILRTYGVSLRNIARVFGKWSNESDKLMTSSDLRLANDLACGVDTGATVTGFRAAASARFDPPWGCNRTTPGNYARNAMANENRKRFRSP